MIATYDMLVSDPTAFVSCIYDRFGFDMSKSYSRYLDAQTQKSKNYKSSHGYSLEQYGLTTEQVVHDFKSVFDRFGFSAEN